MTETFEGAISPGRRSSLPLILALAVILTGLNALKPLHVDDATYYFYAAQMAAHPLDPYGFVILYWSDALPALHVLAPPLLPYWWAPAIRLFGERPLLWKLWLFPFALLFVASLSRLLRRFAPASAMPLLVLLVLSPVFLPSLNLMLDLPALALSLTSLVLFFRACDRASPTLAIVAGVTAALAMQTKYTAFLAPAVLLAYALTHRKMRLGLVAATTAALVFAACEAALVWRYGESHFLYHVRQGVGEPKINLVVALCPILGGVAPTLGLLALTVLRRSGRFLLWAASLALLPFLVTVTNLADLSILPWERPSLGDCLFACTGLGILLCLAGAAWRLVRPAHYLAGGTGVSPVQTLDRQDACPTGWFLVLWLGLELVGYVVLSPFPAVRRIMGITVAATLLLGNMAGQSPLEPWRRNVLRGLVAATALLGFGFSAVDYLEARAEQQAIYQAARQIRQEHPQAVIWYTGYWGFQFYAEQAGMKQAIPPHTPESGEMADLPPSHFRRGDWLVMPSVDVPQQWLELDDEKVELRDEIAITDAVPLSTLIYYYAGAPPLRHRSGPRIVVRLFRFF